jgi:hypothetical protein
MIRRSHRRGPGLRRYPSRHLDSEPVCGPFEGEPTCQPTRHGGRGPGAPEVVANCVKIAFRIHPDELAAERRRAPPGQRSPPRLRGCRRSATADSPPVRRRVHADDSDRRAARAFRRIFARIAARRARDRPGEALAAHSIAAAAARDGCYRRTTGSVRSAEVGLRGRWVKGEWTS